MKDLNGDFIIHLSQHHRGGISLSAFNFEQFDACTTKWLKMDFGGDIIRIRWTHILAGVLYRVSTTDGVYIVKFYGRQNCKSPTATPSATMPKNRSTKVMSTTPSATSSKNRSTKVMSTIYHTTPSLATKSPSVSPPHSTPTFPVTSAVMATPATSHHIPMTVIFISTTLGSLSLGMIFGVLLAQYRHCRIRSCDNIRMNSIESSARFVKPRRPIHPPVVVETLGLQIFICFVLFCFVLL